MADRFKNVVKGGWHPERSSGSSSGGTGDSKLGQVKGWVGRGSKDSHAEAAREHQSAPLSSLKDPASFAPPPKRLDYGGSASPTASRTPTSTASGGLGSTTVGSSAKQRLQEREEARRRAEEEANQPPTGPFRSDTTGLSTAHLPKPPAFRPTPSSPPATAGARPPPSLPPRLPPRQNSNPDEFAPPPPPTYTEATKPAQGILNQGALNRLGQAGVSVPGLGIGRSAPPPPPRQTASPPIPPRQNASITSTIPATSPQHTGNGAQMNELQSRFARLTPGSAGGAAPATGTSWADKQAALRTASNIRDDPSKITAADLKGAASTANNFQQRHGEQVASGWRAANGLNKKYGLADRVNSFGGSSSTPTQAETQATGQASQAQAALGKKAPPPPPKKKELTGTSGAPPPIPLGSKPRFT